MHKKTVLPQFGNFANHLNQRIWSSVLIVNLSLSLFLAALALTNLTLPGTWQNYLFPPLIGIFPLVSYLIFFRRSSGKRKMLAAIATLPAAGFGCLPTLLFLLMAIPPFTLAFFFAIDEMTNEVHIQSEISPDGTQVAEVYFRGVGAYSGGNGRVNVRVHPRIFPWLELNAYSNGRSYASEETTDYVSWINNNTLRVADEEGAIPAYQLYFEPDSTFRTPFMLVQMLILIILMPFVGLLELFFG
jgi:hypothetical protein